MHSDYLVSTSHIELETGLGKELLRKWRQRYGFPLLDTSQEGKVGYSRNTINQLLQIKRLLEGGFRPAQIVGKTLAEIEHLRKLVDSPLPALDWNETTRSLIEQLKKTNMAGFQKLLNKSRANGTLTEFVLNTVVPLINAVGEAWSQKEIEIYHEHICTSVIQRLLHAEILSCKPKRGFPRILFATPPDEHHVLGLLMTEAVFADHGATTLCVGSNTPLHDLKMATISWKADIVALSFSFAYSSRNVRPTLLHVRRLLPPQVEIWAGGAGLAKMRQPPKGICTFSDIQESVGALLRFSKLKLN